MPSEIFQVLIRKFLRRPMRSVQENYQSLGRQCKPLQQFKSVWGDGVNQQ